MPQWVTQFRRDDVVYRPLQDGGPLVEVYVVWRDREVMQSALAFLDYLPGESAD